MKRFAFSALEQGLTSALTLGASLALIRLLAPEGYGGFALWASAAFVLASLQNAVSGIHLHTAPPDWQDPARRSVEQSMGRATVIFLAGISLTILLVTLLGEGSFATPGAAAFVPAFLLQQHTRAIAFSRGRPDLAALQAGAALLLGGAFLALGAYFGALSGANEVLLCLGIAYGSVAGLAAHSFYRSIFKERAMLRPYLHYARQSGWVFIGVTGSELLERFYVFAVGLYLGPVALALLAANQLILRPIPMIAGAVCTAARPGLVERRDQGDAQAVGRFVLQASLVGLGTTVVWGLSAFAGSGLIERFAFGHRQEVLDDILFLWLISAALGSMQLALNTVLQVQRAFAPLAIANVASSLLAGAAIIWGIHTIGPPGAIIGMIVGQSLELSIMGWLLKRKLGAALRRDVSLPCAPL